MSSRFVKSSVNVLPSNPNGSYHEPVFGRDLSTGFNSGSVFHGKLSCAHRAGSGSVS